MVLSDFVPLRVPHYAVGAPCTDRYLHHNPADVAGHVCTPRFQREGPVSTHHYPKDAKPSCCVNNQGARPDNLCGQPGRTTRADNQGGHPGELAGLQNKNPDILIHLHSVSGENSHYSGSFREETRII